MAAPNPANMAAAPNPPLDLPDYVRFSPKSPEVILLLKRFIRKEQMPHCAVKVLADSDLQVTVSTNAWTAAAYPYFEKDEYWFFLHRKQQANDKKNVDRRLGDLGTWKARGRSTNIYIGAQLVGITFFQQVRENLCSTNVWLPHEQSSPPASADPTAHSQVHPHEPVPATSAPHSQVSALPHQQHFLLLPSSPPAPSDPAAAHSQVHSHEHVPAHHALQKRR
ncbi:unnamed protein product [Brassica rapa subsp. trilocularis]